MAVKGGVVVLKQEMPTSCSTDVSIDVLDYVLCLANLSTMEEQQRRYSAGQIDGFYKLNQTINLMCFNS